jgi:hypothetical protein
MQDPTRIEAMLLEAALRLESDGRRIAAETLREAVQVAAAAPTAAARRRRLTEAQRRMLAA